MASRESLRAALEDSPHDGRRRLRRRHRHRPLRPRAERPRRRSDSLARPAEPGTGVARRPRRRERDHGAYPDRPPPRGVATHPAESAKRATERARGLGEALWTFTSPAPDVPLNVKVGPHRRFRWVRTDLDDFRRIKLALGGTVNDVVLAVVAGALRTGCTRGGSVPRASSSAPRCRSRSGPRTSTASSATGSPRCARPCRLASRTRSSACTRSARRWRGSRSPSRCSAPR